MLFLGLSVDIPVGGDPHGYAQIFGFFASFLLLLIIAAAMWCLIFAILATGYPDGITEEWSRIVTIAVGVIWTVVSGWCLGAGVVASSRFGRGSDFTS
jgi:hypothetical protein